MNLSTNHKKKKERKPLAATWMDLETIIPSELRQRKTDAIWYHLHAESSKMIHMNLYTKQKQTHRHENNVMVTKGKGVGGIKHESDSHVHTAILKMDDQQGPTV